MYTTLMDSWGQTRGVPSLLTMFIICELAIVMMLSLADHVPVLLMSLFHCLVANSCSSTQNLLLLSRKAFTSVVSSTQSAEDSISVRY
ncbi:uncharacterized protein EDB91DRAFT_1153729 [Suillus paluster]|uniref:uncharacterized protein n=1 Tax=Suillus paluster TaxID=48578 RepID=UPI001B874401|nr:uncharacterized protein EDB91DRAFT_1153729 [Suillus paluster]KAG1731632.1 hypothetical protein EDB91DRAFT_1153729 [Suillus paluster]